VPLAGRRPQPGSNPISSRFQLAASVPGPTRQSPANQHSNLTRALRARPCDCEPSQPLRRCRACPPCSALLPRTDGTDGPVKTRDSVLRTSTAPRHGIRTARPRLHCTAPTRPTPLAGPQAAQVSPVSVATAKSAKGSGKMWRERGKKRHWNQRAPRRPKYPQPLLMLQACALERGLGSVTVTTSRRASPSPSPSPGFPPATTGLPRVVCPGRGAVFLPVSRTSSSQCYDDPRLPCDTWNTTCPGPRQPLWEQQPARVQTRTGIHRPQLRRWIGARMQPDKEEQCHRPATHPRCARGGATGRHRHRPFAKNGSKISSASGSLLTTYLRPAGHY